MTKGVYAAILALSLSVTLHASTEFVPVGTNEGLGSMNAYQVSQDSTGFIWFYTNGGVDRYDGSMFRHYDLSSASKDFVNSSVFMAIGPDGEPWIAMKNGVVFRYDPVMDKFAEAIVLDEGLQAFSVSFNVGQVWVGTNDGVDIWIGSDRTGRSLPGHLVEAMEFMGGKPVIGTSDGLFIGLDRVPGSEGLDVISLAVMDGKVLAGTFSRGLWVYDSGKFTKVKSIAGIYPIRKILVTEEGVMVAADGGGISLLDSGTLALKGRAVSDEDDPRSLVDNSVTDICLSRDNRLWVTTSYSGACFAQRRTWRSEAERIVHAVGEPNSLGNDNVNCIIEDSGGNLWFGTNNGVSERLSEGGGWRHFKSPGGGGVVISLAESSDGRIWAGCYGSQMFSINPSDGKTAFLMGEPLTHVYSILHDDGVLWIGGLDMKLVKYDLSSGTFVKYPVKDVGDIRQGEGDNLLLASVTGLYIFRKSSGSITLVDKIGGEKLHYPVRGLLYGDDGNLWLATDGDGLARLGMKDGTAEWYREPWLMSVMGMASDDSGYLWVSTEKGIFIVNRMTGKSVSADDMLGLGTFSFCPNSALSLSDGSVAFGSSEGAVLFNPEFSLRETPDSLMPYLFDFEILSLSEAKTEEYLGKSVQFLDRVVLGHNRNSIAISYSAIDFSDADAAGFRYRLKGLNDITETSDGAGRARYFDLRPGRYVFEVSTIDKQSGRVLGTRELPIIVRRPLALSRGAMAFYILLFGAAVCGTVSSLKRRRKEMLSREKIHSFVTVAHELKTPVSLIKSSLSDLNSEDNLSAEGRKSISTASSNVDRLMEMINGLLDLRKHNEKNTALNLTTVDLADFISDIADSFMIAARQKGIEIVKEVDERLSAVPIDEDKMSLIIDNLLSNSLKYTREGSVRIVARPAGEHWELKICDTGVGIPKDMRSKVFKDAFRGSNAIKMDTSGYGIGLLITSQLVRQHRGTITFDSEEGKGTTFTMLFPLKYRIHGNVTLAASDVTARVDEDSAEPDEPTAEEGRNLILIAEDDPSMLKYLKDKLCGEYDVITAPNGSEALEKARKSNPDIVITDLVMPLMNGDEVCRRLKSSHDTSHIPVIILTGMDDREDIMAGLQAGAADYIVKPFDVSVLKLRIRNILKEREIVRQSAFASESRKRQEEYLNSLDKEFMEKVQTIVSREISNPEFQINDLCVELGMSRTVLFNKIKSLTGHGPADYIRITRLEKAREMLSKHCYTITEVADAVGFPDSKYFSVSFKKQFGISPSRV